MRHGWLLTQDYPIRPKTVTQAFRLTRPPHPVAFKGRTYWELRVHSVIGSPTDWSVTPMFEHGIDNTIGYPLMNPVYSGFSAAMNAKVDGDILTKIDAAAFAAAGGPIMHYGYVNLPLKLIRLNLESLTFTGGTNPGLRASLVVYDEVK